MLVKTFLRNRRKLRVDQEGKEGAILHLFIPPGSESPRSCRHLSRPRMDRGLARRRQASCTTGFVAYSTSFTEQGLRGDGDPAEHTAVQVVRYPVKKETRVPIPNPAASVGLTFARFIGALLREKPKKSSDKNPQRDASTATKVRREPELESHFAAEYCHFPKGIGVGDPPAARSRPWIRPEQPGTKNLDEEAGLTQFRPLVLRLALVKTEPVDDDLPVIFPQNIWQDPAQMRALLGRTEGLSKKKHRKRC